MLTKLALALLVLMWGVPQAHADLLFSLNPAGLTGGTGDTLIFNATLTNTGEGEIFLNGDLATLSPGDFVLDDSLFFANFPVSLAGGDSITADLFRVLIGPTPQPGDYFGSYTIFGGPDANAQDELASQNFLVTVVSSAPEPGSLALLGVGIIGMRLVLRRKRRNTHRRRG